MKRFLPFLLSLVVLTAITSLSAAYHHGHPGPQLYRCYFDPNPPATAQPELRRATTAMLAGDYSDARRLLQAVPTQDARADGAALWYLSLLDLREDNVLAARGKLQLLSQSPHAAPYPVTELLDRLEY